MEKNISRLSDNRELYYEEGVLGISNRYTVGVAGERFLRRLKEEGRLYGSRCPKCDSLYVPAKMFCEKCFEEIGDDAWEEVGLRGRLYSYTLMHRDIDGRILDEPIAVGIIEFGSPTARIVHLLESAENIKCGDEFEAVLKPKEQRRGSILDIKFFRKV